ncbi:hypothetical protein GCM10029992_24580 [Glycomyces albus]
MPAELLAEAVLSESDLNVAGALRWALARADRDVAASLARGLDSEDAEVRRRAVVALAEIPGDEATAALADAIEDPDAEVHRRAALELGSRENAVAVPTLVGMIVDGANDVEAAEVLGALARDPERAEGITDALADRLAAPDGDPAVRIRLVQALAELPGAAALEALGRLTGDEDRTVARTAAALIGVIEDRDRSSGGS